MKVDWNKKYNTIAAYACLIILFSAVVAFLFINSSSTILFIKKIITILNPVIYGFAIAFLINPLMVFCEKHFFAFVNRKKPRNALKRVLSLIAAFLIVTILISLFVSLLAPQIASSYKELESKMSDYVQAAQKWVSDELTNDNGSAISHWILSHIDVDSIVNKINGFIENSYDIIINITPHIINFISNVINQLKDAFLGLIFSVYFLFSKEKLCAQIKKMTYAFFERRRAARMVRVTRMTKDSFEGFIIGKIIDSIIIGILTFFVLMLCKMPFYPLIAVIVGFTNIIPFFGPFIGAIPSAFIIFIAEPTKCLWFVLIILIIQQLDGNIIGPKILGQKTNLSALWVMFAIIFMSGMLGFTGMFIGVPIFAVLYALLSEAVNKRLIARGKSRSLYKYYGHGYGTITADSPKKDEQTVSAKEDKEVKN